MNTTRDIRQHGTVIHLGGFRSGKHTILPRTGLPDHTIPFSTEDRNKIDPPNTTAATTDKSTHA